MSLNDSFALVKAQIFMSDSIHSKNEVFSLIVEEEAQRGHSYLTYLYLGHCFFKVCDQVTHISFNFFCNSVMVAGLKQQN